MAFDLLTPSVQEALTPLMVNFGLGAAIAFVGFVGRALHGFINSHKNDSNFAFLTSVAEKAVQAAEQLYAENDGDQKKAFALKFVQDWLAANNIKIDVSAIDTAIEAAVMTEFNFPMAVTPADAPATTDVVSTPGEEPQVVVDTPVGADVV